MSLPDVDIDFADRTLAVALFDTAVSASQVGPHRTLTRHPSGMHFQNIPVDPITGLSAFPYEDAERLGYYKLDFLSNSVYTGVKGVDHLDAILARPVDWAWFTDPKFVGTLFHFGGRVDRNRTMADVVASYAPTSVDDLAVLIAIKLPAKRHLIGRPWPEVRSRIWEKDPQGRPQFKKSHSFAYAYAVVVDAHLKKEQT